MAHSHEASTNVYVFMRTQPIFICVAHHPTFRKFEGKSSCMLGCNY